MEIVQINTIDGKKFYAKIPDKWNAVFVPKYKQFFEDDCTDLIFERNDVISKAIPDADNITILSDKQQEQVIKNDMCKYDFTSWEGRIDS